MLRESGRLIIRFKKVLIEFALNNLCEAVALVYGFSYKYSNIF